MKPYRFAVDTDVRNVTARTNERGSQLKGCRDPHRLDRDVGAEPVGELEDCLARVLSGVIDDDVRTKPLGCVQPAVGKIDGDDMRRVEKSTSQNRR